MKLKRILSKFLALTLALTSLGFNAETVKAQTVPTSVTFTISTPVITQGLPLPVVTMSNPDGWDVEFKYLNDKGVEYPSNSKGTNATYIGEYTLTALKSGYAVPTILMDGEKVTPESSSWSGTQTTGGEKVIVKKTLRVNTRKTFAPTFIYDLNNYVYLSDGTTEMKSTWNDNKATFTSTDTMFEIEDINYLVAKNGAESTEYYISSITRADSSSSCTITLSRKAITEENTPAETPEIIDDTKAENVETLVSVPMIRITANLENKKADDALEPPTSASYDKYEGDDKTEVKLTLTTNDYAWKLDGEKVSGNFEAGKTYYFVINLDENSKIGNLVKKYPYVKIYLNGIDYSQYKTTGYPVVIPSNSQEPPSGNNTPSGENPPTEVNPPSGENPPATYGKVNFYLDSTKKTLLKSADRGETKVVAPATPTKEGFTFNGWSTSNWDGPSSENIDVYGLWTENGTPSPTIYTVNFYLTSAKTEIYKTFKSNQTINPGTPTRNGYKFLDWSSDAWKGTITSDLNIYATWTKNDDPVITPIPTPTGVVHTVKFITDDGTQIENQEILDGELVKEPKEPKRRGYKFNGWDWNFNSKVREDLEITAYWIPVYKVTFIDWDNEVLDEQEILKGDSAKAPSNPSREGYAFNGWDSTYNNIQSDKTIKAVYTQNATAGAGITPTPNAAGVISSITNPANPVNSTMPNSATRPATTSTVSKIPASQIASSTPSFLDMDEYLSISKEDRIRNLIDSNAKIDEGNIVRKIMSGILERFFPKLSPKHQEEQDRAAQKALEEAQTENPVIPNTNETFEISEEKEDKYSAEKTFIDKIIEFLKGNKNSFIQ